MYMYVSIFIYIYIYITFFRKIVIHIFRSILQVVTDDDIDIMDMFSIQYFDTVYFCLYCKFACKN